VPLLLTFRPRLGFGWLTTDQEALSPREQFAGAFELGLARGGFRLLGGFDLRDYRRPYRDPNPGPAGLTAGVDLDEQLFGGRVVAGYDLGPRIGLADRELHLTPYGGLQLRQYVNDVYPATAFGTTVGAQGGLLLARGLQLGVLGEYSYNLGQHLFSAPESLEGALLGLARYGAELGFRFGERTLLTVGYEGSWLALEHGRLVEHLALLSLTFGLEL